VQIFARKGISTIHDFIMSGPYHSQKCEEQELKKQVNSLSYTTAEREGLTDSKGNVKVSSMKTKQCS